MTKVTFYQDKRQLLVGLKMKGHADYSCSGTDIVCAALTTAMEIAKEQVIRFQPASIVRVDEDTAMQEVIVAQPTLGAHLALAGLKKVLEEIEKEYPHYVCIECVNPKGGQRWK